MGDAAHITAASKEGPRYDPNLTPDQRKHESNGIWLCKDCAYIVDHDHEAYSTQTLKNFKRWAEKEAKTESRLRKDGSKDIISGLDETIEKINSFVYEYESNDPSEAYWKKITKPQLYAFCDQMIYKRDRLKKEYSSEKLLEYNKNILPHILDVLCRCQVVLGEADEDVSHAFTEFKISSLDISHLKKSVLILHKLKSVLSWR